MRRVCYIGSFTGPKDEGMRNVADSVLKAEAKYCDTLGVNPSSILLHPRLLKSFNPDILHYISGPTIISLILLELARIETGCKHTMVTATHPWTIGMRFLPKRFRPDLVLAQSSSQLKNLEEFFSCSVIIRNGVDLEKFRPSNAATRKWMRSSLGISDSEYAVLHVGNLREGRNVDVLSDLANVHGVRVMIVSSTSVSRQSRRVARRLSSSGVSIIDRFLPNIEQVYAACDCYVFPTEETGRAIEVPLSVLEAMACNLPIVTTRYGGIPDLFTTNGWFFRFVNHAHEITHAVEDMMAITTDERTTCKTREMVMDLSWDSIARRLDDIYGQITD